MDEKKVLLSPLLNSITTTKEDISSIIILYRLLCIIMIVDVLNPRTVLVCSLCGGVF